MSSYIDQYALADKGSFRQQVASAIVLTANNVVFTEDVGTANHPNRLALAQAVVMNPDLWAAHMALSVVEKSSSVGNTAPSGPATDADVFSAVDAIWNYFANALVAGA